MSWWKKTKEKVKEKIRKTKTPQEWLAERKTTKKVVKYVKTHRTPAEVAADAIIKRSDPKKLQKLKKTAGKVHKKGKSVIGWAEKKQRGIEEFYHPEVKQKRLALEAESKKHSLLQEKYEKGLSFYKETYAGKELSEQEYGKAVTAHGKLYNLAGGLEESGKRYAQLEKEWDVKIKQVPTHRKIITTAASTAVSLPFAVTGQAAGLAIQPEKTMAGAFESIGETPYAISQDPARELTSLGTSVGIGIAAGVGIPKTYRFAKTPKTKWGKKPTPSFLAEDVLVPISKEGVVAHEMGRFKLKRITPGREYETTTGLRESLGRKPLSKGVTKPRIDLIETPVVSKMDWMRIKGGKIQEPGFITQRRVGAKYATVGQLRGMQQPFSMQSFKSLPKSQQYSFQKLAEAKAGRPVSLERTPSILGKEHPFSISAAESEKLMRIYPGDPTRITYYPKGRRITRATGATMIKEIPTPSALAYKRYKYATGIKKTTYPFGRATGEVPIIRGKSVVFKPIDTSPQKIRTFVVDKRGTTQIQQFKTPTTTPGSLQLLHAGKLAAIKQLPRPRYTTPPGTQIGKIKTAQRMKPLITPITKTSQRFTTKQSHKQFAVSGLGLIQPTALATQPLFKESTGFKLAPALRTTTATRQIQKHATKFPMAPLMAMPGPSYPISKPVPTTPSPFYFKLPTGKKKKKGKKAGKGLRFTQKTKRVPSLRMAYWDIKGKKSPLEITAVYPRKVLA